VLDLFFLFSALFFSSFDIEGISWPSKIPVSSSPSKDKGSGLKGLKIMKIMKDGSNERIERNKNYENYERWE
jgi:hypothetical protein